MLGGLFTRHLRLSTLRRTSFSHLGAWQRIYIPHQRWVISTTQLLTLFSASRVFMANPLFLLLLSHPQIQSGFYLQQMKMRRK